ncbi:lipase 1 precursor [Xylogone sp. PMI_703]|nr:lipase 1 precursor [Xylogone sp. PMI_703]
MPSTRRPGLAWLLLATTSVLGASRALNSGPTSPLPPSEDRWYTAPEGFEFAAPGTVLRFRRALGNLTSVVAGTSSAWNILYRTTDSQYRPTFAVTTLFVPANPDPKALLSCQVPYDSTDVDASPSYALYAADAGGYQSFFSPVLEAGWFLNVPDYEGPLASFTAGVMSGHAVIDSVRAVLSIRDKVGIDAGAKYAMWGYSGGALASEWAAELQGQYAPEMRFAGAALGGLTPNITSMLLTISGTAFAGLIPPAIVGLASQFPDLKVDLLAKLKKTGPYNATTFLSVVNMSDAQAEAAFAFQDISNYFVNGFRDIFSSTSERIFDRDWIMGYHGVPQMPIFAHKAIADEISLVADTDKLVDRYCTVGANILYQRNTVGGHNAEAVNGAPAVFEWLASVFGGTYNRTYPTIGCTIQNVTVNITTSPV